MNFKTPIQLRTPTPNDLAAETMPVEKFFSYAHLPEHLANVSQPFCELALHVVASMPRTPERSVVLRKLIEAKDAAVRGVL